MEDLKTKLAAKRFRILLRYAYYEMKNGMVDLGISTPEGLRQFRSCLGWCAASVESISDRLMFRGFENDNFELTGIYQLNNPDILTNSASLSALIASCCFIYVSLNERQQPRLQVIYAYDATGDYDDQTGMLKRGYAILEKDRYGRPTLEGYFEPGRTTFYRPGQPPQVITNVAPYPLLVPVIHRSEAKRPFGHSRISRAQMEIVQGALRTVKRSEITAEFYSFPQKYILGTDPDREDDMDPYKAAISKMLEFSKDEDGDHPVVGQFTQASMEPHVAQLRMFAGLFAGETGLTLEDLGFPSDNPSSQEAIKASHENLRLKARKAQRDFGTGFLNAGYLAACLRDGQSYARDAFYETTPLWEPLFEPDAASLSGIGDGAIKINQAVPGYFGKNNLRKLTGIEADQP